MPPLNPASAFSAINPIVGVMRATAFQRRRKDQPPPLPFVTISRETGAGAGDLGRALVQRLNEAPHEPPDWSLWDRELVEKVAADHHLSRQLLESLEETKRSWLEDLFYGISVESGHVDDFIAYKRVAETIRAMAEVGHVVIVGRGAVFITRKLPAGIHVRLVAPLAFRVDALARRENLSPRRAASEVQYRDSARHAFYARYWPGQSLHADSFTITLNGAQVTTEQAVECLVPLIRSAAAQAAGDAAAAAAASAAAPSH
jgi:cytidylate kinase